MGNSERVGVSMGADKKGGGVLERTLGLGGTDKESGRYGVAGGKQAEISGEGCCLKDT